MDASLLEAAITPRTKAIIPVHMTGAMVDMPNLLAISQARGIPVIGDARHAIKSSRDQRTAGSLGMISGFPLLAFKLFSNTRDGGVGRATDTESAKCMTLVR